MGRRKPTMAKGQEELVVLTRTYDLIRWACHHTSRFPRSHRFVLGERIERNLYDLLKSLIKARYTRAPVAAGAGQPDAGGAPLSDAIGQGPAMPQGQQLRLRCQGD
jgi:hypothetical protein